jgi:hypothetical protein
MRTDERLGGGARLDWVGLRDGMRWLAADPARFSVAFTCRHQGASKAPYDTLNVAYHVGDEPADVTSNRRALAEAVGFDAGRLTTARQVHGTAVRMVSPDDVGSGSSRLSAFEADALVTDVGGAVLAVMVADCVPVVLVDRPHGAAGVVHAGWRGVLGGVLPAAVDRMRTGFGTEPADLVAFIGPHIGGCCLELDDETVEKFREAFGPGAVASPGRVDMEACLRIQLEMAGGGPVSIVSADACTSCDPDTFFSYRRAEGGVTGRQMGIVVVPPSA